MTARPIGYYVHHHGDAHRRRALALASGLGARAILLGTGLSERSGGIPTIDLPDDRIAGRGFDGDDVTETPAALHYAPIDHDGMRRRVARIAGWIAEARPALMVVDVSVEVAMLARLASVPTVVVRLSGRRDDRPHFDAFRAADAVLAPFAASLDMPDLPPWLREKTLYAPGLHPHPTTSHSGNASLVLGVVGRGGTSVTGRDWAAAATATPSLRWRVIGACEPPLSIPGNLEFAGWREDADEEIGRAGVVVGAAGDGLVGTVIAARRPFLCLPEARPFDEQRHMANRLAAHGAAVCVPNWPDASRWPELLASARRLDPAVLASLDDRDGPRRLAKRLVSLAEKCRIGNAQ